MLLKTLLTSSLVLLLVGCGTNTKKPDIPPPPVVKIEYVRPDCGAPPAIDSVELRPLEWKIIGGLFTLTPQGYEDLSFNVSEITRGVRQLKVQLAYYHDCLDDERVDEQDPDVG